MMSESESVPSPDLNSCTSIFSFVFKRNSAVLLYLHATLRRPLKPIEAAQ
ncbi:hypothetical protein HNQ95_006044 [Aminobacter ciceronei]|nr:hypothetical protein [Aminobacter ciceronei]